MGAIEKKKLLSVGTYIMAFAHVILGVYVARLGYAEAIAERNGGGGGVILLFAGMPLFVMCVCGFMTAYLRKKSKFLPALLVMTAGTVYFLFLLIIS